MSVTGRACAAKKETPGEAPGVEARRPFQALLIAPQASAPRNRLYGEPAVFNCSAPKLSAQQSPTIAYEFLAVVDQQCADQNRDYRTKCFLHMSPFLHPQKRTLNGGFFGEDAKFRQQLCFPERISQISNPPKMAASRSVS